MVFGCNKSQYFASVDNEDADVKREDSWHVWGFLVHYTALLFAHRLKLVYCSCLPKHSKDTLCENFNSVFLLRSPHSSKASLFSLYGKQSQVVGIQYTVGFYGARSRKSPRRSPGARGRNHKSRRTYIQMNSSFAAHLVSSFNV